MPNTEFLKRGLLFALALTMNTGLFSQTKDLPRLAQDDMRVCGNALNAVGRANPLVGSCKYVWAPIGNRPFAQGEISDRNSHNPLISTNVTSSYGVTAYDITGAVMATDQITLNVAAYTALMHFPAVMAGNTTTPFSVSPTRGQTFENLDNDDNDNLFDNQDNDVSGTGDDELIRLEITAEFQNISITETNPLAAGSVRFWADPNRTTLVGINSDITMTPIANSVPLRYKIELWVEGVSAHDTPDKYGFQVKYAGGVDCGLPMAITVLGVSGITFGGNNNGYVNTRNAEPTSNTLDAVRYSDSAPPELLSYRVFADARSASPTVANDVVTVSVSLSVAPIYPVTVYLRTFDVDDPTPVRPAPTNVTTTAAFGVHQNYVDPNDNCGAGFCVGTYLGTTPTNGGLGLSWDAENDNRIEGGAQNPKFGQIANMQTGTGIAALEFPALVQTVTKNMRVSHHPGDNYRLAANGDRDFVFRLVNRDAVHQHRICNFNTNTEIQNWENNTSHVLTVWRVLHVEAESMPTFVREGLQNQFQGYITDFRSPSNSFREVSSCITEGIQYNGVATDLRHIELRGDGQVNPPFTVVTDLSADQGDGRFEGGSIWIGLQSPAVTITRNDRNSVNLPDIDLIGQGFQARIAQNMGTPQERLLGSCTVVALEKVNGNFKISVMNVQPEPGVNPMVDFPNAKISIESGLGVVIQQVNALPQNNLELRMNELSIGVKLYDDDQAPGTFPFGVNPNDYNIAPHFSNVYILPICAPRGSAPPFLEHVSPGYNYATALTHSQLLQNEGPTFWGTYVLFISQLQKEEYAASVTNMFFGDNDPDGDVQLIGRTTGPHQEMDDVITFGNTLSMVCVETTIDRAFPGRNVSNCMAHEIGHQFGLNHGINDLTNASTFPAPIDKNIGLMGSPRNDADNTYDIDKFCPIHQNLIRSRIASPGQGY